MASHVYLQYHPMQSCAAIDPSAGRFGFSFGYPGHRRLVQTPQEQVNGEQEDNILRETNKRLVHENEALRSERDNDEKERRELRRENEKHQGRIKELQFQFQTSQKDSIEKAQEIDLYQKQIKDVEREKIEANNEYERLHRWALVVQGERDEANRQVHNLQGTLKVKDIQYADKSKLYNKLWTRMEALSEKQISKLPSKVDEYELENKNLRKENEELKHE